MADQGPIQLEVVVQVPELNRLVTGGGGQLLAIGRDETLEDVRRVGPELVHGLKVGRESGAPHHAPDVARAMVVCLRECEKQYRLRSATGKVGSGHPSSIRILAGLKHV